MLQYEYSSAVLFSPAATRVEATIVSEVLFPPVVSESLPGGDADFHRRQAKQLRAQAAQLQVLAQRHEIEAHRQERIRAQRTAVRQQAAYDAAPQRTVDCTVTPVLDSWIHPDDLRCTSMKRVYCTHCQRDTMGSIGMIVSSDTRVTVCHRCQGVTPLDGRPELMFKVPAAAAPELHLVEDLTS